MVEETVTIYYCDECGGEFDERDLITYWPDEDETIKYHVCPNCIGDFTVRMKEQRHAR